MTEDRRKKAMDGGYRIEGVSPSNRGQDARDTHRKTMIDELILCPPSSDF